MNTLDEAKANEIRMVNRDEAEVKKVRMINNVRVYAIADKYNVLGLKELAKMKFKTLLAFSAGLVLNCPSVICEIYDTTPSEDGGLREMVTSVCTPHVQEIIHRNDWSVAARIRVDFTFDLLRASAAIYQAAEKKENNELLAKQAKLNWKAKRRALNEI